ncbi:MAG: DinB family protein [Janthinobacterium lividum]
MKTIDYIRMSLEVSSSEALALIETMQDSLFTFPTSKGGNHPLWILGHQAVSEAKVIEVIMLGSQNPLAHWWTLFGPGTEAVGNREVYPPYDEVMKQFQEVRSHTLTVLNNLTEADLDQNSKDCPAEYQAFLGTFAQCFRHVAAHFSYHAGQVADAHRMAGR